MVRLMFLKVKARLFPCRPRPPLPFKIYTNNVLIKTGFNLIGGGGGVIHAINTCNNSRYDNDNGVLGNEAMIQLFLIHKFLDLQYNVCGLIYFTSGKKS